jgi:hypothetical protein
MNSHSSNYKARFAERDVSSRGRILDAQSPQVAAVLVLSVLIQHIHNDLASDLSFWIQAPTQAAGRKVKVVDDKVTLDNVLQNVSPVGEPLIYSDEFRATSSQAVLKGVHNPLGARVSTIH